MIYLLNTTKNGRRNSTLKFIEEVHNCPTVRDVSSLAYKETKNKQKKMVELANKLCFVETFVSSPLSISSFFFCYTVLRECHCIAQNKSAMWQITVCCDLMRVWRNEFASLPTASQRGEQYKFGERNEPRK